MYTYSDNKLETSSVSWVALPTQQTMPAPNSTLQRSFAIARPLSFALASVARMEAELAKRNPGSARTARISGLWPASGLPLEPA